MSKLAGFTDEELHPQIVEALKVLAGKQDDYANAMTSLEGQYLRPIAASHDGLSDECLSVLAQVEAVRALSFVESAEAVELALEATKHPMDYWIDYTLQHTLGALESQWKPGLEKGELAKDNPAGRDYLKAFAKGQPIGLYHPGQAAGAQQVPARARPPTIGA